MRIRIAIYSIALFIIAALLWNIRIEYSTQSLKEYLIFLSTVSGMIFTIMGIWVAWIYPNALKRLMISDKLTIADFSQSKLESRRLESIIASMLASLLVVASIIIILFLLLLDVQNFNRENIQSTLKTILFVITFFLTIIQLDAIFSVIFSNVMFINDIYHIRKAKSEDQDL